MSTAKIAFIGGGHMASSLILGLLADGYDKKHITVADLDASRVDSLVRTHGIIAASDNRVAASIADVVVLAVKPQVLGAVCADLAGVAVGKSPLFVSIAAGIRTEAIYAWLKSDVPLIRAMPNTPAAVRAGATALYATPAANQAQKNQAESLMRAVGITVWLDDESLMDTVTALSGSGPAYMFLLMEAMENAAIEMGLPADTARTLTCQTAFGAAKIALESNEDVATLRHRVTSPGGTTEKALQALATNNFEDIIKKAIDAARKRSIELADRLGDKNG